MEQLFCILYNISIFIYCLPWIFVFSIYCKLQMAIAVYSLILCLLKDKCFSIHGPKAEIKYDRQMKVIDDDLMFVVGCVSKFNHSEICSYPLL